MSTREVVRSIAKIDLDTRFVTDVWCRLLHQEPERGRMQAFVAVRIVATYVTVEVQSTPS